MFPRDTLPQDVLCQRTLWKLVARCHVHLGDKFILGVLVLLQKGL